MFTQAAQRLVATAREPSSTEADFKAAVQEFINAGNQAQLAEANEALAIVAELIELENLERGGFVALVCGAMVERGCDPAPLARPLGARLRPLLERSVRFAEACKAQMPKPEGEDHDPQAAFEQVRARLSPALPEESAAWQALEQFWRPTIVLFSLNPVARNAARGLREPASKIADLHEGAHWLQLMLSVLDNEPILAIEPATLLGIEGRISGVVDNFQLNTLLMDGFPRPGFLSRRRVSRRVAEVARGNGPQQTGDVVTAVWNLHTWKAIEPGLKLPDPNDYGGSASWIWNEGSPEDIPVLEGRRVILIGPASYPRSWTSQRMFDKLPAKLECEKKLTKEESKAWLEKMLAAKT